MSAQQAADAVKDTVQSVADKVQSLTTNDYAATGSDGTPAGSTPANAPPAANHLLDEVTGEYVSKTELKKRQKLREKAQAKAGKEKKAPPAAKRKAGGDDDDESKLSPHQYFELRSRAVKRLKETQNPNPYPHKFHVTYDLRNFEAEFGQLKKGELVEDRILAVGCRIYNIRTAGENLRFYEVAVDGAEIQIMATNGYNTSPVPFAEQHDLLRRGDIIGVKGFPGRTSPKKEDNPGELSIMAQEVTLLAPCLHQIPSEHYGFKDQEERYRNRHLDLIMNKRTVDTFKARSNITKYIRNYFDSNGFYEVETPILMKNAGGATAKPFFTEHLDLKMTLALRIATELPLKQLVVGGINRVYEIGRQFRNEGIDLTHNPEFTTCEYYEAFTDLYDVMARTEELVEGMVTHVCGSLQTKFHTQTGDVYDVNWAKPWKRIEMMPALEAACGETFPPGDQLHTQATNDFLRGVLKKMKVECTPPLTNARMLDKLVGDFIEEQCVNPTFITGHPQMMSPLAKYHRATPGLCERFEAFVCKKEIVNAYTELNDPFDQRLRFEEQARQKAQGDDECQVLDEGFLTAMEYGLPPTGGWGMGIDRMVMFLTDHYSIKEVLTFPMMKDVEGRPKAAEVAGVEAGAVEGIAHK
ncbi:Protein kinase [Meristemomyces frigidus]|nr:Protein kinase [Meristemomyces frigidus]